MTPPARPSYWSFFGLFLLFLAGPLLIEMAVYLARPATYPASLPLPERLQSISLVFLYYGLPLIVLSAMMALIQLVFLRLKLLYLLVALIFFLFYAMSLSRILFFESGFTLFRSIVFFIAAGIALLFAWLLSKYPVSNKRLWIGFTIHCAIVAFLLQHLFALPFPFLFVFVLHPLLAFGLVYFPSKLLIAAVVFGFVLFFQTKTTLQPFSPPIQLSVYDRVILIGIDALSPDTIQELRRQKKLRAIESLISNGVWGRLKTLDVPFSPLVWNTIYTGAHPHQHGVMAFTFTGVKGAEPFLSLWLDNWTNSDWSHLAIRALKQTGVVKTLGPANARSRKLSPIWSMVNANKASALVIGGWTTYPPEKINGTIISDYAFSAKPGTMGIYHPPQQIIDEILTFQPATTNWPDEMKRYVARDIRVHNAAVTLLTKTETKHKFVFAYYSSPDAFGHHYGTHIGMSGTPEDKRKQYLTWRDEVYRMMDNFLQDYLKLVDDKTLLIVCSDHGFNYDKRQHNYPVDGTVMLFGKGVRKNIEIRGDVFAIAPTVLYALGMPRSTIFAGFPMKQAFEGTIPEPAPRTYPYNPKFLEIAGQEQLEEDKLRELEDLQYINR